MVHSRDLENVRRHRLVACKGRVRAEPGRRDLVWNLGLRFPIGNLDEFSVVSTQLVALMTP